MTDFDGGQSALPKLSQELSAEFDFSKYSADERSAMLQELSVARSEKQTGGILSNRGKGVMRERTINKIKDEVSHTYLLLAYPY
jgi:hypothetical protein